MGLFASRHRRRSKQQTTNLLDLQEDVGQMTNQLLDFPGQKMEASQRFLRREEPRGLPRSYRTGFAFFGMVLVLSLSGVWGLNAHMLSREHQDLMTANLLLDLKGWSRSPGSFEALAEKAPEELPEDPVPKLLHDREEGQYETIQEWRSAIRNGWEHYDRLLELFSSPNLDQLGDIQLHSQLVLQWWDPLLAQSSTLSLFELTDEQYREATLLLQDLEDKVSFVRFFATGASSLQQILGIDQPQRIAVMIWSDDRLHGIGGELSAGVELLVAGGSILQWTPFHLSDLEGLNVTLNALDGPRATDAFFSTWESRAGNSLDLALFVSAEGAERMLGALRDQGDISQASIAYSENFERTWNSHLRSDQRDQLQNESTAFVKNAVQTLQTPAVLPELWPLLQQLVVEKQVLALSPHEALQPQLTLAGLNASLPELPEHEDLLMISHQSVGGDIPESEMQNSYQMHVSIDDEGTIKHWLHLQREALSPVAEDAFQESIVQVLVPSGSRIDVVDGLENSSVQSHELDDFVVWSFPLRVEASQPAFVAISYTLPWTFETDIIDNYRLHWLKQVGAPPAAVETAIKLPPDLTVFQSLPPDPLTSLQEDVIIAVVAGRNP